MNMDSAWDCFFDLELEPDTRQQAQKLRDFCLDSTSPVAKFLSGRAEKTGDLQDMRVLEKEVHESLGKGRDVRYGKVLRYFVEYVNRNGWGEIPLPAVPIRLEAQPSIFTDSPPSDAERADGWRLSLNRWVESGPAINSRLGLGALLVSASLNSGVVDSGALLELLKAASQKLTVVGDRSYVDLELPWRGSANLERGRWFPDAASPSMFLRLKLKPEDFPKAQSPAKFLWPLIKLWFKDSDCRAEDAPRNFSEFTGACRALNYHELPMDVGAYLARRHISHSLRSETWSRLHHVYPATQDCTIQPLPISEIEVGAIDEVADNPSTETFEWASELWSALKGRDRASAAQKLKKIIDDRTYQVATSAHLLTEWALALCTRPASSGKAIALATVRQYLTQAGKRLAALSDDENIAIFDAAELEELYTEVIADSSNPGFTDKLRKGLREFHHFLHCQYGVPRLSEVMNLGGGSILHPVDANVISLDEYYQIRSRIRDADLDLKAPGLSVIAELIFVLGFRCGLRRKEALGLRIKDIHLLGRPEIIVRRYNEHRLKTDNAVRKIPLYALLDEEELKLLSDWCNRHHSEEQAPSCKALFSIPRKGSSAIDQELIFPVIHGLMRQEAGDQSLRYHHLRHSFASWTFLRLSLAQHGKQCELLPGQPLTEQWLDQSNNLQMRLLGERHRVNLYAIARLLGHAGPDMSLEHYIHTLDLAGLAMDERRTSFTDKTIVGASGVPASSAYRLLKNSGVAGLLKRIRADNPGKVNELFPNAKPDLTNEPAEDTLRSTLDRVERYLKYRQRTSIEKGVLAERFGLSDDENLLIENQVEYLAELRSNDKRKRSSRHRFAARPEGFDGTEGHLMDLHTEPRTRTSKEAYWDFTNRVEQLLREEPEVVWEVVEYYIHNQWKTWSALIFRDSGAPEMARKYLHFLGSLGFRRSQLQFICCDPSGRSVALARWKRALGLSARDNIKRREPTNKRSRAVAEWLFVAPIFSTGSEDFDDRLFGYRYLMVMLATAMPLLNSGFTWKSEPHIESN